MQTGNEPYRLEGEDWVVRVRPPQAEPAGRTLLLIHGWTGDETVMWIFARSLPENAWLFAPRAPVPASSGFAWLPVRGTWPALEEFRQPCAALLEAFDRWAARTGAPADRIDVMGFSQGAAMSYALAAFYPERIGRVLALAGFLPVEEPLPGRYTALRGKPVYIAHGTKDEIVPVTFAEQAVQALQAAGAGVTYCASDVGHKLGANCLKGIDAFFEAQG